MVFLNGVPLPIYGIDTQESRLNRIAWMMKTLPMFIHTEPGDLLNIDFNTNIAATDLIFLIKRSASEGDFLTFYNENKDKFTTSFEIFLYMYMKYVPEELKEMVIMTIEVKYPNVDRILEHPDYDQTSFLQTFLEEQTLIEQELQVFNTVVPVPMDKMEVQKITFEVRFKMDVDLVEIFDQLKVSAELPYLNNGDNRHKIYRNFKNLEEGWEMGTSNAIRFFVLNTKYPPLKFNEKYYSQGFIVLGEKKGEALLSIETIVGVKNNLEDLLDRVFTSLKIAKSAIFEINQESVSSTTLIPGQRFNSLILKDIILNDPLISSLCAVDESVKMNRVRSGLSFFYQPEGSDNKISIALTEFVSARKEYRRNPKLYPYGTDVITVRINKAKDEEISKEVSAFVGKIFRIYLNKKEEIITEYKHFIPTFAEFQIKDKKERRTLNRLQDLVPSIFIPGYARKCQNQPVIIDHLVKEQKEGTMVVDNPTDDFTQALLFPKNSEEGPQHWYGCPNKGYPGLRQNTLKNADQFPYLPCCYPNEPQTEKVHFKNYYYEYNIQDSSSSFSYILKTLKVLDKDKLGLLPTNLVSLFQNLAQGKVEFYRKGTDKTPKSFVEALSTAFNTPIGTLTLSQFALCRQNGYNTSPESLREEYDNPDYYINPSIYYRALEEYFKCYIIILTHDENVGRIVHPQHRHVMLRYQLEYRPVVMVFENHGTESDSVSYPQCELVVSVKDGIKNEVFRDDFATDLMKIYSDLITWYTGSDKSLDISKSDLLPNIISQGIDSFGKTRSLLVAYGNKKIFALTDPLPPLNVPENNIYKNNKLEDIMDYIKDNKLEYLKSSPDRVIAVKNSRTYYFPYNVITTSAMDEFNKNQRIARYLQEYSYYLYSKYGQDNEFNPNNINTFLRENTIVIKDYQYPKIPRRFDLNGPYLNNKKLIVHSLEMAQRLGYSIELLLRRDPNKMMEYSNFELIQDYYLDKNDFTQDPNAIILMTEKSLVNWVNQKPVEYTLNKFPTSNESIFYLELLNEVVLIQMAETFENAVYIANMWNTSGFNPSITIKTDEESNYMYYVFESPSQVIIHGRSKNKVLVWREDDQLFYGAILK